MPVVVVDLHHHDDPMGDNEKLLAYLREAGEKKERDRELRREDIARRARLDEATTAAEENRIIMIDLDTISDPRKRAFVRMQQENIYRKNAESFQQPPTNDAFDMYGVNFGDLGGSGSNLGPF